jgi:hypothetical protein
MAPKGGTMKRKQPKTTRHGGRVVLSLDVEPSARDALREKAAAAGVSMAEYFTNAIAQPEQCTFRTDAAEIGRPLIRVSDHQRRALEMLKRGDVDAAVAELEAMRAVIHDALTPLARRHQEEVRANERRIGVRTDYRAWEGASRPPHEER